MRIATFNINGIRAAQRRGFEDWLRERNPDVVALQEVRAPAAAIPQGVFGKYHLAYDEGTLPGRNGVGILTLHEPAAVRTWSGTALLRLPGEEHVDRIEFDRGALARGLSEFAHEGRYVEVDLADAPITVASLYLPKGGLPAHLQKPGRMRDEPDGGMRYQRKMRFLSAFARQLTRSRLAARAQGREFLIMGDFNVAHTRYDVRNWRRRGQAEGFLPEERAWFDSLLSPRTLVDVVRRHHPEVDGPYSWWSWLGESFASDSGWRIDYHLATPRLGRTAISAGTDRDPAPDRRISDHAPVVVDYDI
ncbi:MULTISPECIES: exodeoxyribonuclease III [Rhodococcus]|uniref:exodeoxyribonuclease III n=1 Tax=Rhodococcus TaxID=1827 RepID=UPI001E604B54|nr:exodeoxyribonuclease III [Rhodococcus pyridinivorans]MCD2118417.1 endonuclease/exonuclease/phosphatase family protein [Rhodococcus pyridinivorans]MCZ4627290.1 exodeoxyribonuclease III [Rhodococcus pyridinivorans]MCZ4648572.1 exodeoxyribonuclease III [Rhodococcus pyridinivorans]MDJ0482769.1 exodeoxyribonuclease III [Rhodococcus pyridinivorans]MDV7254730.1 exodeoxyribonuclease III [Rhodococcus pyridinivorans]